MPMSMSRWLDYIYAELNKKVLSLSSASSSFKHQVMYLISCSRFGALAAPHTTGTRRAWCTPSGPTTSLSTGGGSSGATCQISSLEIDFVTFVHLPHVLFAKIEDHLPEFSSIFYVMKHKSDLKRYR